MPHVLSVLASGENTEAEICCRDQCIIEYWHEGEAVDSKAATSQWSSEPITIEARPMPVTVPLPNSGVWKFKVHSQHDDPPTITTTVRF